MTPVVQASDVAVSYGENVALDGVDLTLESGQVHGLIGMNGSGKSSLFKALMGLVRADRGRVELFGDSSARARAEGRVAYVPQSEEVDWAFPVSVRDVATMGRYGRMGTTRRPRDEDRQAVEDALARVELTEFADRQIGKLSGGQRKRAFLARALAQGAELLLLDEPFAGVDKRSEATITGLLGELADEGLTIMVSTHDLVSVPALCASVALLNRRVIAQGPPSEVLVPELLAEAFGGFVPQEALGIHREAAA